MKAKHILAALAVLPALAASPAEATMFSFDLTGAYNGSFTIDGEKLNPPGSFGQDYFEADGTGTFDGVPGVQTQIVTFNTLAFDGGMTVGSAFVNLWGEQLFTGGTTAPALRTGNFVLRLDGDDSQRVGLRVAAVAAAVPEPATWGMMILGFGVIGAMGRRRSQRARVRFA